MSWSVSVTVAVAVSVAVALVGCGDDDRDGPRPDGGVLPDGAVPMVMPEAPMAPAPPAIAAMGPCRTGWREVDGPAGVRVCDPFPEVRPTCGDTEALFPGGAGCESIGPACPVGEWAEGLPASGVLYVRAGGGTGGMGTEADPFRTITAALGAVPARGTIIALGKGTYDEPLMIRRDVEIVGACSAETTIGSSTAALGYGVIEVGAGRVRIANLTVSAPRRQGIRFEGDLTATLEGVRIDGVVVVGLGVFSGARVTARNLVVRRTGAHDDGSAGRGIDIEDRGVLTIERGVVEDNRSEGIAVLGPGCELHATDLVIARTARAGDFGDGITATDRASIDADGIVLEDNALLGALVLIGSPSISLANAVVRGNGLTGLQIGPEASGVFRRLWLDDNGDSGMVLQEATATAEDLVSRGNVGRGLTVQGGAELDVSRAVIAENGATGVIVASTAAAPSRLSLLDAIVRRNEGRSIQIQETASATLRRIEMSEALGTELVVRGAGVTLEASDLYIHDPRREPDVTPETDRARGVEIRLGAGGTLERVRIERAHQLGVFLDDAEMVTITDLSVSETTSRDDIVQDWGRGIEVQGTTATLTRVLLERNGGAGMVVSRGSRVTASDVRVADTHSSGLDGITGKGVVANGGSELVLMRALLERNREVSLAVFEEGTRIVGTEVAIVETLRRECAETSCAEYAAGIGVGAYLAGFIELEDFVVDRSALIGVQIDASNMELRRGVISRATIGINVLGAGVDYASLLQDVSLRENERNIDAMVLPLPDTTLPPVVDP